LILGSLLVVLACDGSSSPVSPPTTLARPQFDFGQSQAEVLGTTNQGELVRIVGTGAVEFIGDAGSNSGLDVGWTGLAFDDAGNLFAMSRALLTPFQSL
jgi:hypothetical protein